MDLLQFLVPLGWIDLLGPILPFAILVLALANVVTRLLAHRTQASQAQSQDEVDRYTPHTVTTLGLAVLSFLMIPYRPVGGTILATITVVLVVTDVFEFEARNVEARNGLTFERPKSSLLTSSLVLLYAGYYCLVTLDLTFWRSLFA